MIEILRSFLTHFSKSIRLYFGNLNAVLLLNIFEWRIAKVDDTAQYWPNLGSQQLIYHPSAETWPSIGLIPSRLPLFLWHPVPKVEKRESGPWTAHYWAMCHFYHGKPFWKWENQSLAQHRSVAVLKTSVSGQSLGQNWPPSAYRSYHSSNGTILATDLRQHFCRCWTTL